MKIQKGLAAAPGCVLGKAALCAPSRVKLDPGTADDAGKEIGLLSRAREAYIAHLCSVMGEPGSAAAEILGAYLEIAQDEAFFSGVEQAIRAERLSAAYAVQRECRSVRNLFSGVADDYLRERAQDIDNVCGGLTALLLGNSLTVDLPTGDGEEKRILFAEDLAPDMVLSVSRDVLGGIVTERGGLTSHTVILAKALGIPAVVGAAGILETVTDGAAVLLSGDRGEIVIDPDFSSCEAFRRAQGTGRFSIQVASE